MHLQRIQVPDFRVLKDVDITFEREFVPRIFPLGSLNGGGKSTLLQLIFVLLHCSSDPKRIEFLKNILQGFHLREGEDKRILAIIDIWHLNKIVKIHFFALSKDSLIDLLKAENQTSTIDDMYINYFNSLEPDAIPIKHEISMLEEQEIDPERYPLKLESDKIKLAELHEQRDRLKRSAEKIDHFFRSNNYIHIFNYSTNKNETELFLCHIDDMDTAKAQSFLKELSQKIFLAAPATQMFIFLPQDYRGLLFASNLSKDGLRYFYSIQESKEKISGLFVYEYDFIGEKMMIESLKAARDRDFREVVETGEYGDNYKTILNNLNSVLGNKRIETNTDLSGVTFKLEKDGETIQLYPEDLSHGELKRLSIYLWIKYRNIENAIVLMDEIEIAFHPDWQYQIISDLKEWGATNQYILATHSYELCQALTPAHVKEIEPKLIKTEAQN